MSTCETCGTGHRTIAEAQACGKRPTPEPVVLVWDYNQQPDMDALAKAVRDISGGTVRLYPIETGSSDYALVIAATELDEEAVAETWNRHYHGEEG